MNRLALAPVALLACGAALTVSMGYANDPALKLPGGAPIRELAPKPDVGPLAGAKKLELVNKSIKVAGGAALTGTLAPPFMKVGPVTPVQSGAKIAYASPIAFVAPAPGMTDGAYMLTPPAGTKSSVRLELLTEAGKFYLVDCRIQSLFATSPLVVSITRGGATQALGPDDGHVLYTFKSDGAQQKVQLSTEVAAAFYGCEITKIQ